ncbi:MAG TPA: hypothetical protein VN873_12230 [Candidatus Angelobacter sp.]|nr:hypothetical protein [Candidatus Angelobacter sp.]
MKKSRKIAGILLGALMIAAGIFFVVRPQAALVFHQDTEDGNFLDPMTKRQNRICGFIEILIGAGLIGACRWPKWGGAAFGDRRLCLEITPSAGEALWNEKVL